MQNTPKRLSLPTLVLLFSIACPAFAGKIIYVDADAAGANDGSSWTDAYNYLQDALADANTAEKPVESRVAQGLYTPDSNSAVPDGTGNREATFRLINGVTLKGGYAGFGEPDPNERDIDRYETILSGDLNGDDEEVTDPCDLLTEPTRAENSFHVVAGILRFTCSAVITVEIDGFTISGGNANGPFSGLDSHGAGGGIGLVYNCYRVRVANCAFRDNSAEDGGAIGGLRGSIVNCLITNNAAVWNGGGLGWCTGLIQGCTMEGNYAENHGGAMYLWGESPQIENCTFSSNRAESGGGLFIADAAPNLVDCTFSGNSAVYGGGMHSCLFDYASDPTLVGCAFIDNAADSGGGMYNADSGATLTNCTFTGNQADSGGGAMYNASSDPVVQNCTFAGNSASQGGGMFNDMYEYYDGNVTVIGCTFAGNSATGATSSWGGAGAMYNYCGYQTLINCLFSENTAAEVGNALFNVWCTTTMINCTVSSSESDPGAGMFIDEAHTQATNCIFSDGVADYDGFETIAYCNVLGGWPGVGNIDADPLFADPNNDDYHLKSQAGRYDSATQTWVIDDMTSPCIDAGDPMSPIGPEPFPNGGVVNMGAYGGSNEASKSYFDEPVCETIVAGDINGDCAVNFLDFRLMALHWMEDR